MASKNSPTAGKNGFFTGLDFGGDKDIQEPVEKSPERPVKQEKPAKKPAKEKSEKAENSVIKTAPSEESSLKERFLKKNGSSKKLRKVAKTVYLTEELDEKVKKAVERGEIKSFNDLIVSILNDLFSD